MMQLFPLNDFCFSQINVQDEVYETLCVFNIKDKGFIQKHMQFSKKDNLDGLM